MALMLVVIAGIVLDLAHDAWVEWRRFLWGDVAMRLWEKRRSVSTRLMGGPPRDRS
jgi:hypothetical protein